MNIFPAIDLYQGKAVRLFQGDYQQMTVYSEQPETVALAFKQAGAQYLHLVDLEGAKHGTTSNLSVIKRIVETAGLFTEVGGGIRNLQTISQYLQLGVDRVILGTAAVTDEGFLQEALAQFGSQIAVGVDLKDGFVATHGWTKTSNLSADVFLSRMQNLGVRTVICTDITKDGAMQGTNRSLYRVLSQNYSIDIIASGGVSSLEDIRALKEMNLYGAIIGKAYYTGAINLSEALEVAR